MFPPDLKLADVTPVSKNKNSKDNYRSVSILPNMVTSQIESTELK